MSIVAVGISHKSAPIEVRERLAIVPARLKDALASIGDYLPEAVILSTCNRVEVYASASSADVGTKHAADFLAEFTGTTRGWAEPYLYEYRGTEAIRHLFRVACGLDSMALGESEILGQVRDAMVSASEAERLGAALTKLFHRGLRVGRAARTRTGISRHALSVSTAGVERARVVLGGLGGSRVLVISAGEAGKLAAKSLRDAGAAEIGVANRTRSRAAALAEILGGHVVDFDNIAAVAHSYDVVISATAAEGYVLDAATVEAAMVRREGRPMCLIDLAAPRDIDPRCREVANVFLYDVDDLKAVTEDNRAARDREAGLVEAIIEEAVLEYEEWVRARGAGEVVKQIQGRAETIRKRELEKSLRKLGGLSDEERERVETLTRALTRKLLHDPSAVLKARGEDEGVLETARALFRLDTSQAGTE